MSGFYAARVTTGGAAPEVPVPTPGKEPSTADLAVGPDQGFLAAVLNNLSDALVACGA